MEYAQKNFTDAEWKKKDMWYEKLHEWQAALDAYQKNAEQQPDRIDVILGQMRCLEALGEWLLISVFYKTSNCWLQIVNDKKDVIITHCRLKVHFLRRVCLSIPFSDAWMSPKWTHIYGPCTCICSTGFYARQGKINKYSLG